MLKPKLYNDFYLIKPMTVKYGLLLKKSWQDFRKNLIVLLPILPAIIIFIVFGLFLVAQFILYQSLGLSMDVKVFGLNEILFISIFSIIDFFLLVIIGSILKAMSIGLINQAITKKKATSNDMWLGMKRYTGILFRFDFLVMILLFLPLGILGLLIFLGFSINLGLGIAFAFIFGFIGILYLIAIALLLGFGFFFALPILTKTNVKSAIKLMKESFNYTKQNLTHVLLTWLIIVGIGLVLSIFKQIFFAFALTPLMLLIMLPFILVYIVASIIVSSWLQLFLFNAYYNKDIKKL